jgi:HAD superfamily hydrolase (TIGR01509 family)
MHPRALLLDLDGTLADSHDALWDAYRVFLEARDREPTRAEFERLDGPSLGAIAHELGRVHGLADSPDALEQAYVTGAETAYASVPAMPGAEAFLSELRRRDVLIALVTSAPRSFADAFVERTGWSFDAVITGDDGPAKPDPALYETALARLGVDATDAIAVEDSPNGVTAARAASLRVIGVARSETRRRALLEAGADGAVSSLADVLPLTVGAA